MAFAVWSRNHGRRCVFGVDCSSDGIVLHVGGGTGGTGPGGVGELIVFSPDEVIKYSGDRNGSQEGEYQPLARAMGIEFVDGRDLAMEQSGSSRWAEDYRR